MSFTVYASDPLFLTMERAIDRALNNAASGKNLVPSGVPLVKPFTPLAGSHAVDVIETDQSYKLVTDAPGLTPEDIAVEVHEGVLTISGQHTATATSKDDNVKVWRQERQFRKFTRSFALPENADVDALSASLDKGVLTVTVAKRPEPEKPAPKRIAVQSAPQ